MPKFIDLTGQRFGRLTVLSQAPKYKGRIAWNCRCDCGNELVVISKSLRNGNTKSCGCLNKDKAHETFSKLKLTHGGTHTVLFRRWSGMIARCTQPSMPNYATYGGRGISVCDEWLSFENFRDWAVANGFSENLTLDRIDPNGNYEPSNCRWATAQQQSENKRNSELFTFNGESHCLAYWSRSIGLSSGALKNIIRKNPENAQAIVTEYLTRGCGKQEYARRKL